MGYRSQVGYMIQFRKPSYGKDISAEQLKREEDYAKHLFYLFLTESKAKSETMKAWEEEVVDNKYVKTGEDSGGDGLEVDYNECRIRFSVDDVKWHGGYEDVACHTAIIDLAEEYVSAKDEQQGEDDRKNEDYVSYTFVRVGEEEGDIESRTGGNGETSSYLYPVSSIHWDI